MANVVGAGDVAGTMHHTPAWFQDAFSKGKVELSGSRAVIETLEGKMRAEKGDWVIRGVQGELYACKPDIFQQTYEAAE